MIRQMSATGRLALVIVSILGISIIADALLRGARLDLTERSLFTVSPATRALARGIDTPIELKLYFSRGTVRRNPNTRVLLDYATSARDLIGAVVAENPGALSLVEIDPVPFSEAEDEASLAGLQAVPLGVTGQNIYLGLVAETEDGRRKQIPFLQPDRHAHLEYELARMLSDLDRADRPVIGIYSELRFEPEFDFQARRELPGMLALEQLRERFDIEIVDPEAAAISASEIDLLLVVHPKSITPLGEYRIEQYLLGGGRAMVFLDVDAQADTIASPGFPTMPNPERASSLPTLLRHWGIEMPAATRFADRAAALQVSVPGVDMPMRHLAIVGMETDNLNDELLPLQDLQQLIFVESGYLLADPPASITITPLISGGAENGSLPVSEAPQTPGAMNAAFRLSPDPLALAVLVRGTTETAFPDGPPAADAADAADTGSLTATGTEDAAVTDPDAATTADAEAADATDTPTTMAPAHIESGEIALAVFADTDVLANTSWVNMQSFLGREVAIPFASNGDLVANLVDFLGAGEGLIGIRGREQFARPFDRVLALQRQAEERYLAQQQALETELQSLESRLVELESRRDDSDGTTLSDAQLAELERFQEERVEVRRELRAVQRELTEDIEHLGNSLKLLNIVVLPLFLVGLLAGLMRWLLGRWPV